MNHRLIVTKIVLVALLVAGCGSPERTLFREGEEHLQKRQYTEADIVFTRYITLDPDNSEGFYNRGLAATGLARFSDAEADFSQAILLDPYNVEARWMRYRILACRRESIRNDVHEQSGARPVLRTLASALSLLMVTELGKILEMEPLDMTALCERGLLFRSLGRFNEAKEDLDVALSNSPGDIWILNERGRLMHEMGRYEAAVDDYDAALATCDTCTWLLYNKALSLKTSGHVRQAAEVLKQLLMADNLDGGAWFMLGECMILLERRNEAREALTRSLNLGVDEAQRILKKMQMH